VYCFPHAGGNARTFLCWQGELDGCARVAGVVMPGRAHRYGESVPPSIVDYADGAAAAIEAASGEQPYYLFGHSLGALVAFEVARRLAGSAGLRHLVASGAAAPSLLPSARVVEAAALQGRAFAEAVGFFGGLPPEIMANEDLQTFLLPVVQADFRLVAQYRYAKADPLPVGISLVNGTGDPHVTSNGLVPWAVESREPVRQHWSPGGHFYFEDHPRAVPDVLREVIGYAHSELMI
jgi:surfactin synthase thioesterase subunit